MIIKKQDEQLLSQTISFLRFPLVVLVVFLHHNVGQGLIVGGANVVDRPHGMLAFFVSIISDVFSNVGVPLFFLFSGFLFFYHCDEFNREQYYKKIKKRLKSLLLPYLIWNAIALVFALCRFLPIISYFLPNLDEQNIRWSFGGFLNTFWNMENSVLSHNYIAGDSIYPIDQPLWYVRDLMIVMLCSPLIYYMVKAIRYYWVVLLGIIWLFLDPIKLGHINQLMTAFLFFSWGAAYSIQSDNFVTRFKRYSFLPFIYILIAILDTLTKDYEFNIYIHDIGIIAGIVSFVLVASFLIEKNIAKPNALLTGACFFVYAGHDIILNNVSKLITKLWYTNSQWYLLANYILIPVLVISFFLGLYALIRKHSPSLLVPLTGGR